MEGVLFAALVAAMAALWVAARSAVTVCLLEVREGRLKIVRGGIAARVLSDIEDVVAKPQVHRATLRIVRSGRYAQLKVKGGVSEAQRQRLRNVIGSVPLAQLVNARRR
jgi:Protein of unknown function (DUF3634)